MKSNAIVSHSFEGAVGQGVSKGQSADMTRKHLAKLKCDLEKRNIEVEIETLRAKISADRKTQELKRLRREYKELKQKSMRATEVYLGSVSTGLTDFMPGKSLSEKLGALNELAEREVRLLENGGVE